MSQVQMSRVLDANDGWEHRKASLSLLLLAGLSIAAGVQVLWSAVGLSSTIVAGRTSLIVLDVLVVDVHRFVDLGAESVVVGGPVRWR